MFGGGAANPYDEIVVKATDENQTSENWEVILNLCDKVVDEGQDGAHNAVSALIKRLTHRNANVQLYALTLAEALVKNCTSVLHHEISSKAFTQALDKLVTDRTAHEKVKKRALGLISEWSAEWENDESLGVMESLYDDLKRKGYKFEQTAEPLPPSADDEVRRKEEEELQRVLELSMKDTGGRGTWSQYSLAASTGGTSSSSAAQNTTSSAAHTSSTVGGGGGGYGAPKYQSGYVPARTPSPATQRRYNASSPPPQALPQAQPSFPAPSTPSYGGTSSYTPAPAQSSYTPAPAQSSYTPAPTQSSYTPAPAASAHTAPAPAASTTGTTATSPTTAGGGGGGIVTRVRALHTFEPSEPGELAFEKGDIIKVVDRGYKDWWRGQLKGRTGIFPVNYVEPMPEPSKDELAKEAEMEAKVFEQAVNVERLLAMLKNWDVEKESLADDEEVQELYRSCMSLRPKIVKLIDKYSQKRADLVSMNESFVRARSIFDRMMEESLARHTGIYDQQQPAYPPHARAQSFMPQHNHTSSYGPPPPGGAPGAPPYGGWNQQGPTSYDQPPPPAAPPSVYPQYGQQQPPAGPAPSQGPATQAPGYGGQAYTHPEPYGAQGSQYVAPQQPPQGPPPQGPPQYGGQPQQPPQQQQQQPQQPPQNTQSPAPAVQPSTYGYTAPYSGQGPTPYPAQTPAPQQGQGGQQPYGGPQGYNQPPPPQNQPAPQPQQQQQLGQQPPPQQQPPQQQQQQPAMPAYGTTPYAPQQPPVPPASTPLPDPHPNIQHRQSYQAPPQQQQQGSFTQPQGSFDALQQPMQPSQAPPAPAPQPAPVQATPAPAPAPKEEEVDDLLPLPNPLEHWGSTPTPATTIETPTPSAPTPAAASVTSPVASITSPVASMGGVTSPVASIGGASPESLVQRRQSYGFGVGGISSPIGMAGSPLGSIGSIASPVQEQRQSQGLGAGSMNLQQQMELGGQATQPLHIQPGAPTSPLRQQEPLRRDSFGYQPLQQPQQSMEGVPIQEPAQQRQQSPVQQPFQPQAQAQQQPQPQPQQQPHQAQQQQQQQSPQQAARQPPQRQQTYDTTRPLSPSQVAEMLARGPPYVYDPSITYPDPNVQAWAQYFAQGGLDKAGAVYFVSVPGVTGPAQGPPGGGDVEELDSAMGSVSIQEQQQVQVEPQRAAPGATRYQLTDSGFIGGGGGGGGGSDRGASPARGTSPASTPSWVLPKRGAGTPGGGSGLM